MALTLLCAGFLMMLADVSYATPQAQAILAESDKIRNPNMPFSMTVTLIEFRNGAQTDETSFDVYTKTDTTGGHFRSLIRFLTPARDVGKLMLKSGNDLWFYDPSSYATIRVSPRQRLLGQAANGDVVTVNLATDYLATLAGEEDVRDGDGMTRHACKLSLTATSADVTYDQIEIWIDQHDSRPIKSKFYTESGRLLKTAYYRHFQEQLGANRPTETVIIDGLNPDWITIMRFTNYAWRDISTSWLQPDYLPHFAPN